MLMVGLREVDPGLWFVSILGDDHDASRSVRIASQVVTGRDWKCDLNDRMTK